MLSGVFSIVTGAVYAAFGYGAPDTTDGNDTLGYPDEGTSQPDRIAKTGYTMQWCRLMCGAYITTLEYPDPDPHAQQANLSLYIQQIDTNMLTYEMPDNVKTEFKRIRARIHYALNNPQKLDIRVTRANACDAVMEFDEKIEPGTAAELKAKGFECLNYLCPNASSHVFESTINELHCVAHTHATCASTHCLLAMAFLLETMIDQQSKDTPDFGILKECMKIVTSANPDPSARERILLLTEKIKDAFVRVTEEATAFCPIIQGDCPIDQMVQCPICNNGFSREALKGWFRMGNDNCPICKTSVFETIKPSVCWTEEDQNVHDVSNIDTSHANNDADRAYAVTLTN
jgi:hypothetical protein